MIFQVLLRGIRIERSLATVKSRDKENVVSALQLIRLLALELPVGVVDEHEDARAAKRTCQLACSYDQCEVYLLTYGRRERIVPSWCPS